ncbi:MAG: hypothetical protein NTY02_11680 [Acidobacteria bacterium]|nr:hypothetical protein [Acidobacteriota bacterium]
MMPGPQSVTPVIIKVVPPDTAEVSIVDVLVNSFGLIGLIVIASVLLGVVVGILLIGYSRWRANREGAAAGSENTRLDLSSPPD